MIVITSLSMKLMKNERLKHHASGPRSFCEPPVSVCASVFLTAANEFVLFLHFVVGSTVFFRFSCVPFGRQGQPRSFAGRRTPKYETGNSTTQEKQALLVPHSIHRLPAVGAGRAWLVPIAPSATWRAPLFIARLTGRCHRSETSSICQLGE